MGSFGKVKGIVVAVMLRGPKDRVSQDVVESSRTSFTSSQCVYDS